MSLATIGCLKHWQSLKYWASVRELKNNQQLQFFCFRSSGQFFYCPSVSTSLCKSDSVPVCSQSTGCICNVACPYSQDPVDSSTLLQAYNLPALGSCLSENIAIFLKSFLPCGMHLKVYFKAKPRMKGRYCMEVTAIDSFVLLILVSEL